MIAHITGTVIRIGERFVVLQNNSLGYKVFVSENVCLSSKIDAQCSFWTHTVVREDAYDLFGFRTEEELSFFELLISISGIGPKTALGILNMSSLDNLTEAISSGETAHLVKVSGIGKKTAEKIVLELRDKFKEKGKTGTSLKDEVEALEALKFLGYSHKDAREALEALPKDIHGTSARVKHALKALGVNIKQ